MGRGAGWWKVANGGAFWRDELSFASLVQIAAGIITMKWTQPSSRLKILLIALPMPLNPHLKQRNSQIIGLIVFRDKAVIQQP